MRRPARSPSALLTLQFRNDISEPWMSDWIGTVLSMSLPPLFDLPPLQERHDQQADQEDAGHQVG